MIRRLQAVALDCSDPVGLAEFYARMLGGQVVADPQEPNWVEVHGFEGTPLAFQRVQDHRPPQWPRGERPQQMHLDFDVDDLDAEEKRVLELGATVLERTDQLRPGANWRVYADPAGHPFCLCRH
ncbi:VOC family protein [Nocardiopsis algeriensis]|uniref:Putative enzyme related to lactoylglutathione lyase n=1 Tax=Nocardiopsis algeriensis TaxID=1478215 RepID=A0A841IUZ7_9ACTN|nr:VOC family protein [Nocardiopsis algeriensis]MBB6119988.1 putative enzyme related to lactoylglutathione lyase [Nocardiopsis algeriensis]